MVMVIRLKNKHKRKPITLFDIVNSVIMLLIFIVTLYPFWYTIMASFSTIGHVTRHGILLYPNGIHIEAYTKILANRLIPTAYRNTLIVTIVGTSISMILTVLGAYVLSIKTLPGRTVLTIYIVFTMMFSGGLIPTYLLVNNLGMVNTLWALFVPCAVSAYNMVLMRNFFSSVPIDLYEAAEIVGITRTGYLLRILLPLSTAALATIGLFYAVGYWNNYFNSVIYVRKMELWPMQMVLHQLLKGSTELTNTLGATYDDVTTVATETMKCAMIVITVTPILVIYPFIQKYFVKGVMVGSLKG